MTPESLGPYAIGKPLGKGGMGAVYRAEHRETGDVVAVKVLHAQLAVSEGFRERFEAEIESLQTLRHAGIVRLLGYGQQEGALFYAMELVDGPSLEDEIRQGRRFAWREATLIAIQVSRALKHAHDHGVIHRDIKPANILLDARGRAKIADFGIARLFGSTGMTVAGGVLGTADYMAPEQAAGQPVTARCDQYSLGGVLYALLAGRPPFRARDLPSMLQMQRYAVPEAVRRYAPDTPAELDRAVMQLLAKDPKDRFPNTLVLARHLEAMTRALSQPAPDDFELYEASAEAEPREASGDPMAVTRDATAWDSQASSPTTPAATGGGTNPRSSVRADEPADEDTAPLEATHYTTVVDGDEEAAASWRPVVGQALVLAVAVGTLAGAAWWWTTPLGADALYDRLAARHERGSTDRVALEGIQEFLERFPDDERAGEVTVWRRELQRDRIRKRAALARLGGGDDGGAIEALYRRAARIAERDRLAGAQAFDALAALLEADERGDGQAEAYAGFATDEAERLREAHRDEQRAIIAFAEQRLSVAHQRRAAAPADAAAIASGVLLLVERTEATAAVLDRAEALLASLRRGR